VRALPRAHERVNPSDIQAKHAVGGGQHAGLNRADAAARRTLSQQNHEHLFMPRRSSSFATFLEHHTQPNKKGRAKDSYGNLDKV
jgi:hypothetical protein